MKKPTFRGRVLSQAELDQIRRQGLGGPIGYTGDSGDNFCPAQIGALRAAPRRLLSTRRLDAIDWGSMERKRHRSTKLRQAEARGAACRSCATTDGTLRDRGCQMHLAAPSICVAIRACRSSRAALTVLHLTLRRRVVRLTWSASGT